MREIIFDTETTGFDPQNGDRMVEIGCIEMINRVETGQTFHCYYNPQRSMPKAAEEVHGLSDVFLSDKKLFSDGAEELLSFLQDSNLVAHNAQFDFKFLNAELVLCGYKPISQFRMIDTLAIAKSKHPGAKLSLDALCSRYGIDRSHRVKHGALLDAELLTQLYIELTGGRQIGLGLADDARKQDPVRDMRPAARPAERKQFIAAREHHASEDELARHRIFIEGIENPLWSEV
ncbi:DNA polymerase III subunit epsilon [Sphingopyxis sp. BSNA05]|uniref:DNA polymerase III subunit epsilon n=1 Tax=Sphingomonadales TaxID=204457 RepID=UPI000C1E845D|nr:MULTISPECIES: DNA polymerase III subunit epsilon [Sphingomonadaceae]ATW03002.1 DNA polymerase III subunit epsilon [Sphingorhabdus sp. YGSMI21]NRD89968.1 DNA polymerase III subunit epsilon [Sphingopyxis sp. BSNA05]